MLAVLEWRAATSDLNCGGAGPSVFSICTCSMDNFDVFLDHTGLKIASALKGVFKAHFFIFTINKVKVFSKILIGGGLILGVLWEGCKFSHP